jgi:hypothetical protein
MPPVATKEERDEAETMIPGRVPILRRQYERFPINTEPAPHLKRVLRPCFLLPYLFEIDARTPDAGSTGWRRSGTAKQL